MKKSFLLLAFAGLFSLQSWAQIDDMYFTPGKSKTKETSLETPTYYVGSNRDVDEYNRRGRFVSSYQPIGMIFLPFGKERGAIQTQAMWIPHLIMVVTPNGNVVSFPIHVA